MTSTTEVAAVPTKENALAVFRMPKGLDPFLAKIREEIDGFIPDVTTRKGREAIASIAHKVARSKTALDNVGKELVAELKDIPKKIDAERRELELKLQAEQAERDSTARAEAAAATERQRQADEKAEEERQANERAANTAHKTKIMKAAKEGLMKAGLTEEQAKLAVVAIAKGLVPNTVISF